MTPEEKIEQISKLLSELSWDWDLLAKIADIVDGEGNP